MSNSIHFGNLFPFKSEASTSCSNLCIPDIASEQEEQFYGDPFLNVNNDIRFEKDPTSLLQEFLQPDINALENVTNFNALNNNSNSLKPFIKPIMKTDQLVKLMDDQKPFFNSCGNIIIAQKPLDMGKGTGRMAFEMADFSLIENHSKFKMFLRDAANDDKILELRRNDVDKKNKCKCFAEHNNSLFCVRSRYNEAVQVLWSEEKSYASISVEDVNKFELLFAPLIAQSKLKNPSSIIMQLVFQMETEYDILEQFYFIKFLMSPKRDIENFIKTLVNEKYVDESYLEEIPGRQYGLFKSVYVANNGKTESESTPLEAGAVSSRLIDGVTSAGRSLKDDSSYATILFAPGTCRIFSPQNMLFFFLLER
ncbi:hypothetical protein Anas_08329 [Armadillidium nasatum]|uniref:Uncharacterized protein n=1 Tax=Armadillidium nasatum TaxID=96803 RepID=A0A5N5TM39_9CRUS|nr:hypothetical protein Anas_08329 [Armadillidium nasatum]